MQVLQAICDGLAARGFLLAPGIGEKWPLEIVACFSWFQSLQAIGSDFGECLMSLQLILGPRG